MANIKWSAFPNGTTLQDTDQLVGLRTGDNYRFSLPLSLDAGGLGVSLVATNSAMLVSNSTGVMSFSSTLTNGQLIIGSTGATPSAATLTAGSGISISNGAASITISSAGGVSSWQNIAGTTQAAAVNTGYVVGNASQTTVTLPATAALGSVVAVQGKGAAGWILTANTGQVINVGNTPTSSGGTVTSANLWDAIEVVCVTANTTWALRFSVTSGFTIA